MATTSIRATTALGRRQSALGFAGNALFRVLTYALMLLLALVFLFPFYMMVIGSFMSLNDLFSFTPNLWPLHPTFDNYTQLFKQFPYYRYLFNSFALAAGQTAGVVFFCSLAGFIFAKRQFPGRDALFVAMLITLMVPGQSTLIPFYLLMAQLGWLNTFLPLWIPFWAPAFGVFLMRQFIASTIPNELLDAGTSDGCSLFGLYWRIVIPIMLPAITILALLNFINAWNDFLYSLLIFNSEDMRTAPLALALFLGSATTTPQYTWLFAGSVLATLPLVVLYFVFQRRLMEGIMSGALKG
jgi:ABC-type glycerol-3-phosphate transport system permease component